MGCRLTVNVKRQKTTSRRTVKEKSFLVYKRTRNSGSIAQRWSHLKGLGLRKNIRTSQWGVGKPSPSNGEKPSRQENRQGKSFFLVFKRTQ